MLQLLKLSYSNMIYAVSNLFFPGLECNGRSKSSYTSIHISTYDGSTKYVTTIKDMDAYATSATNVNTMECAFSPTTGISQIYWWTKLRTNTPSKEKTWGLWSIRYVSGSICTGLNEKFLFLLMQYLTYSYDIIEDKQNSS